MLKFDFNYTKITRFFVY